MWKSQICGVAALEYSEIEKSLQGLWVDMYVYLSACSSSKVPHANLTISLLKTEWTVNVTIHVSLADSFGCCVKSSAPLKLPTRCFICLPLTAGRGDEASSCKFRRLQLKNEHQMPVDKPQI